MRCLPARFNRGRRTTRRPLAPILTTLIRRFPSRTTSRPPGLRPSAATTRTLILVRLVREMRCFPINRTWVRVVTPAGGWTLGGRGGAVEGVSAATKARAITWCPVSLAWMSVYGVHIQVHWQTRATLSGTSPSGGGSVTALSSAEENAPATSAVTKPWAAFAPLIAALSWLATLTEIVARGLLPLT